MEWGRVIKNMGLKYVEAVPDLECEPLLTPEDYRKDWIAEANRMQEEFGMKIVMFYSNDSTYDTIGISHPDKRVRDYFVSAWFENFLNMAAAVGSDAGYYVQATPENLLYTREGRQKAIADSKACMVEINRMAKSKGIRRVALEQMYTPHQPPFTIEGMHKLIMEITAASGHPFYLTEDVGHHCPLYIRPTHERMNAACVRYRKDGYIDAWLGSNEAKEIFCACASKGHMTDVEFAQLSDEFDRNADQFNELDDTDCYAWLRKLAGWSPVVHLQQTDGCHSSHEPFLPENNAMGKIHPVKVLQAIKTCYEAGAQPGMPDMCEDIYLIQELYMSTKDIGYQGLHKLQTSTDFLRRFIPEDGLALSQLLEMNGVKA
jgi:hypothetical protein